MKSIVWRATPLGGPPILLQFAAAAQCSLRSISRPPRRRHVRGMRDKRTTPPEPPSPNDDRRGDCAPPSAAPARLTPRQRTVAALLVQTGFSYKEIAAELQVREGTLRTHAEHVYRALG